MQFNENFSISQTWQVLNRLIENEGETATFFVNNTRYFLFYNLLQDEYKLLAFLPHSTIIMTYSHVTGEVVENNFVGHCFGEALKQTTLTITRQQPKLTRKEIA